MSSKSQAKARFSTRMPNGDYLSLTIWPGKSDPAAEVLTIQVRRQSEQGWETVSRLAVYRTADGRYSQLPERQPPIGGEAPLAGTPSDTDREQFA